MQMSFAPQPVPSIKAQIPMGAAENVQDLRLPISRWISSSLIGLFSW